MFGAALSNVKAMRADRLLALTASLLVATGVLSACSQSTRGTGTATTGASTGSSTPVPASATDVPAYHPSKAALHDCTQVLTANNLTGPAGTGTLTASCGVISVPLDYSKPNGTTIDLTVVRIHSSRNTHSLGDLQVNPGGPGGSGLNFALGEIPAFPATLFQHFDIVGFDPRGVGLSTPISCATDKQKDAYNAASPDMSTVAGFSAAKSLAKSFDQGCVKDLGSELPYFNTVNTARDMDAIRQALGDAKMNYLGFSYGTELGSVYAHLFPQNIRVAVLDGAVDPLTSGIEQFGDQLKGFELAFDQFAAYCPTSSTCRSINDPRATAENIEQTALKTPLKTDSSRKLTFSLAANGILQALYSKSLWPDLAAGLIAAQNGDGTKLLALADQNTERDSTGKYTNIADANTAISCNDTAPGPSDDQIKTTTAAWATQFPLFGKWAAISLFSCQQWQPIRTVPPKPTAPTPTKVLVIGNLHDPATPYQGAKDMTTTMGNAELLSWDGEGHTSYLQGSSCVDNYVNAYLVNQTLPPPNTTCPK